MTASRASCAWRRGRCAAMPALISQSAKSAGARIASVRQSTSVLVPPLAENDIVNSQR